jgi:hypothetical protein
MEAAQADWCVVAVSDLLPVIVHDPPFWAIDPTFR